MNVASTGAAPEQTSVLFVDDDPTLRMLAGDALEAAGFAVTTAPDGEAAPALL